MFSSCAGRCDDCVISYIGGCIAGHGDDDFSPITEEIAKKLVKENSVKDYRLKALKNKFPSLNDVAKESQTSDINITNCTQCNFHKILPDPDPDDWFCDDDVKVMCTKENRNITVACRPHHVKRECNVPKWCPLTK